VRNQRSRPLVTALETWLREQRKKLSAHNQVAKAIAYSINRWTGLVYFSTDRPLAGRQFLPGWPLHWSFKCC
jgi:transposase